MDKPPKLSFGLLHLLALSGFAVAQPVYDLLGRYPEFLVVHGVDAPLLLLFAAVVSFGLPLLLVAIEWVAGAVSSRLRWPARLVWVSLLAAAFVLQLIKHSGVLEGHGVISLGVALVLGGALAAAYARFTATRTLLSWLSIAAVVFVFLFLLISPARHLLAGAPGTNWLSAGGETPVVFVVFDELPLLSLLDGSEEIDAGRYPHFAALAEESYWFSNATTVSEGTLISLPAILDGKYPTPGRLRLPNFLGHPLSLFSLLGGSHEQHIFENLTRLAPPGPATAGQIASRVRLLFSDLAIVYGHLLLPLDLARHLPPITDSWKDFGKEESPRNWDSYQADWQHRSRQFQEFIAAIEPAAKPGLYFLHSMLPHASWKHLPDGRLYALFEEPGVRGVLGANSEGKDPNWWLEDTWLPLQGHQRHLLQVGFVDTLLGQLINRLREQGIYDDCLLVVTADHGTAFLPDDSRREITESNYPAILWVPLFIKAPRQREPRVITRNVETIDILPTIADILEIELDWELDGRSAIALDSPERSEKTAFSDKGRKFVFPSDRALLQRFLRHRLQVLGAGNWDEVFKLGDRELLGSAVPGAVDEASGNVLVELAESAFLRRVDPESQFIPARISGQIVGGLENPLPRRLAVGVNGRIEALTQTSPVWGGNRRFAALIPPQSLQPGFNRVEVYEIRAGKKLIRLPQTGGEFELLADPVRLVASDSKPVPLDDKHVVGWVVGGLTPDGDRAYVGGWAADRQHLVPVETVLVFLGERLIASGSPKLPRQDAVSYLKSPGVNLSGFTIEFPLLLLPEELSQAPIRVLGLSKDGVAAELNYPAAGPQWLFASRSD